MAPLWRALPLGLGRRQPRVLRRQQPRHRPQPGGAPGVPQQRCLPARGRLDPGPAGAAAGRSRAGRGRAAAVVRRRLHPACRHGVPAPRGPGNLDQPPSQHGARSRARSAPVAGRGAVRHRRVPGRAPRRPGTGGRMGYRLPDRRFRGLRPVPEAARGGVAHRLPADGRADPPRTAVVQAGRAGGFPHPRGRLQRSAA